MHLEPQLIIARCLAGDDAAKAEFILAYGDMIRRIVAQKLASMSAHAPIRQDVDDIANDVLLRLLDHNCAALAQVRERHKIDAWLNVITRHYTVDYVRKWSSQMCLQGLVVRETPAQYSASPAGAAMVREAAETLRAMIEILPPAEKLVLELYYTHGMTYDEIAGITGRNINTVATHVRRARERLRGNAGQSNAAEDAPHAPIA